MRIFPRLALLLLPACLAGSLRAAAAPASIIQEALSNDLTYLRVPSFGTGGALPDSNGEMSVILDLRFATAAEGSGPNLAGWVAAHARPDHLLAIIVNPETSAELLQILAASRLPAGAITIGPADADWKPDVPVKVTADADRRAYDLQEQGIALTDLVATDMFKPRFDEAALAQSRAEAAERGNTVVAPQPAPQPQPPRGGRRGAGVNGRGGRGGPGEPPRDLLLQRAVQLYIALQTLHRLE